VFGPVPADLVLTNLSSVSALVSFHCTSIKPGSGSSLLRLQFGSGREKADPLILSMIKTMLL